LRTLVLAAAIAAISVSASAQQADPTEALIAEWRAMRLSQDHTETAISRLIQAYETRLVTAMEWLKAAQDEAAQKQ
jgi:hypothetical protein